MNNMKAVRNFLLIAIYCFIYSISTAQTQTDISGVTCPTEVDLYDMIEIQFNIGFVGNDLNYYDPEDCNVYGTFTNGSEQEQVIAFYYAGYTRNTTSLDDSWQIKEELEENSDIGWRLRFTPKIEGQWYFTITAIEPTSSATNGPHDFNCIYTDRNGFIKVSDVNDRYFEYDNGGSYMPVGQNYGWYRGENSDHFDPDELLYTQPYGTHEYDYVLDRFEANKANYYRKWIGTVGSLAITPVWDRELDEFFYNTINQKDAWRLDYILEKSRNSTPQINLQLCFFTHQNFRWDGTGNEIWEVGLNPYASNCTIPGPCDHPWEFFTNVEAKQVTKNHIRYIIARWGYATNILAWELFNEVDKLYFDGDNTWEEIGQWHNEMCDYILGIDDNHLISTSFSDSDKEVEYLIVAEQMDFVQPHFYKNLFGTAIGHSYHEHCFFEVEDYITDPGLFHDVPVILGETDYINVTSGDNWLDPFGYQFHCMNFAQLFSGSAGAAGFWTWPRAMDIEPPETNELSYYTQYKAVAELAESLELDHAGYSYHYEKPDLNDNVHLTYMVSDNEEFAAGWGQDQAFEYNNFLTLTPPQISQYLKDFFINDDNAPEFLSVNRIISIEGLKNGLYKLQWFDTEEGGEIEGQSTKIYCENENLDFPFSLVNKTPYGDFAFVLKYENDWFRKHPYFIFQNSEESPGVYTSTIDKIRVQWQTTHPLESNFYWGYDDTYSSGTITPTLGDDFIHYVELPLSSMQTGTKIFYKVSLTDPTDSRKFESSFITPPASDATEVSFYAYGDTRGLDEGIPAPFHNDVCNQVMNEIGTDISSQTMMLHCADWAYKDSELSWQNEYFNHLDEQAIDMRSKIAVMGAYGNHEAPGNSYKKYWPYTYDEYGQTGESFCYSFDYGPVHVIVVNLRAPGAEIDIDQEVWIINDLENTDKEWKIMMFHAPAYSNTTGDYHFNNVDGQNILQPLCEQYGVQMVIAGHCHYYAHWIVNGVHHLTLGGGGTSLSWPDYGIGEIIAERISHFAKIDISGDYARVDIIEPDGVVFESFNLPKTSLQVCNGENQTWEEDITYADEVRVCTGSTLTIKSEVGFVQNGKLIIERGGKLILDGGVLTNAIEGVPWKGVEVWGNSEMTQSYAYQGTIEIINNGTIANAKIGIQTIKMSDLPPPSESIPDYTFTGGMVFCDGAMFINNNTSVKFWPYEYDESESLFRKCQFITNNELLENADSEYFIEMNKVAGIDIAGCDFIDEKNYPFANERTSGIESFDANYSLFTTDGKPNVFSGLYYGIKASSHDPRITVSIKDCNFNENVRSVYLSTIDYAILTGNTFSAWYSQFQGDPDNYCMYLDYCTDYTVEENKFKYEGLEPPKGIGLVINNSGDDNNEIYNNTFESLEFATLAQNCNRGFFEDEGLVIKCNDYWDNYQDIAVTAYEEVEYPGIAPNQGAPGGTTEQAGNRFSLNPNGNEVSDYSTFKQGPINYYHHDPQLSDELKVEPVYYSDDYINPLNQFTIFDKEISCESNGSAGGSSGANRSILRNEIEINEYKTDSIQSILSAIVDGGSTEVLTQEIVQTLPPDVYDLYLNLINNSPYLSDSVLIATIEKEDILPNVIIKDVLVANPQSAKSPEIMDKVDDKVIPMTSEMKAEILLGKYFAAAKENLEAKLAHHKNKRSTALKFLKQSFLNDTIDPFAHDSLIVLLESETGLREKYQLVFAYMNRKDSNSANNLLSSIPSLFSLSPYEQSNHDDFTEMFNIVSTMYINGIPYDSITVPQKQTLLQLADNSDNLAGASARNVLIQEDNYNYIEPIILPELSLKSSILVDLPISKDYKSDYLVVYPNPAKDYVVVELNITNVKGTILTLFDNNGKIVKRTEIPSRSQVEIPPKLST